MAELNTKTDRMLSSMEQGRQAQQQEFQNFLGQVQEAVAAMDEQTSDRSETLRAEMRTEHQNDILALREENQLAIQELSSQTQQAMEGMLTMISGMTDSITQLAAAKESNTSTPLVTTAEDPETTAALLQAHNMFLTGHEAIEADILAQINLKSVDPATFSRHREISLTLGPSQKMQSRKSPV